MMQKPNVALITCFLYNAAPTARSVSVQFCEFRASNQQYNSYKQINMKTAVSVHYLLVNAIREEQE